MLRVIYGLYASGVADIASNETLERNRQQQTDKIISDAKGGMHMTKFVTGVGSRKVDRAGSERITEIAKLLDKAGYTLRSGGADGCDSIFEAYMTRKEIYLPWRGFNGNQSNLYNISKLAYEIAATVHPHWYNLKDGVKKLHARNVYQVLGTTCNKPSNICLCWTPDACKGEATSSINTGGTRTAIVLADRYNVPIYNLKLFDDYAALKKLLIEELKSET